LRDGFIPEPAEYCEDGVEEAGLRLKALEEEDVIVDADNMVL
jgi:hypothetical protein